MACIYHILKSIYSLILIDVVTICDVNLIHLDRLILFYTHIYIYICVCMCVYACVCGGGGGGGGCVCVCRYAISILDSDKVL